MRCNHLDEVLIEKAAERVAIIHRGLVPANDPVVGLWISVFTVAR
jgi:hypothetical protein